MPALLSPFDVIFANLRPAGLPRSWSLLSKVLAIFLAACGHASSQTLGADAFAERVVWGINLGGEAYTTRAGETLEADDCTGGVGQCRSLTAVARSQNETIYQTFRQGDQDYDISLAAGRYDLVLYFVEPSRDAGMNRRFDVLIENGLLLESFNLLEVKGLQPAAAVTRTFPGIVVDDGELNVTVRGTEGEPILAGILIRTSVFSTEGWTLTWFDEFAGEELDAGNWTAETWDPGRVNNEIQAYTAAARNVRVEEGVLVLEAHPTGMEAPAFTSGRVHSWGKRHFLYGRLDISARVPGGRGAWPALWLLPDDPYRYATTCHSDKREWQGNDDCDAWPNSGEIDLMEHVGYEPDIVHGTVHTRDYFGGLHTQVGEAVVVPDLGEVFHTYTLLWEPGQLAMFIDGVRYFSYFDDDVGIGQWPFDHAFHIVMNLAVGGDWGAARGPVVPEDFPRRLEVDYVRLYERAQ